MGEVVDGVYFSSDKEISDAKKDKNIVEQLRKKTDLQNKEIVLKLYKSSIERNIFSTQLGYNFLVELRNELINDFKVNEIDLPKINLDIKVKEKPITIYENKQIESLKQKLKSVERRANTLTFVVVILMGVIVAFIYMIATNQNIGYINTEQKIINKYSTWEENLKIKEKELNEREKNLSLDENFKD